MSDPTVTAKFLGATHKGTTRNGNPRYEIHTSEGTYTMATDASLGYSIGNYTGGPDSLIDQEVVLTFTKTGNKVYDIRKADK